jgi:putative oxidoreductase
MKSLIRMSCVPSSVDCGLLALRLWLGLSMLLIHGLGKLQNFSGTVGFFGGMGIPAPLAWAAILNESLGSVLLIVGLATRWAALAAATGMLVAFIQVHHMVLAQGNPHSGELAFIYLGGYVALLMAGPGRWSLDAKLAR